MESKKEVLRKQHEKKLIELYNAYYDKALSGESSSLKAFIDVSKELFNGAEEENDLNKLLRGLEV